MTTQQTEAHPVVQAQSWANLEAKPSSKLGQLHAQYEALQAEASAVGERLDAVKAQLKAALAEGAPDGSTKVQLATPGCTPVTLVYSESWRVDAKRLKAADPETYVRYAVKAGRWTLAAARGTAAAQGGE